MSASGTVHMRMLGSVRDPAPLGENGSPPSPLFPSVCDCAVAGAELVCVSVPETCVTKELDCGLAISVELVTCTGFDELVVVIVGGASVAVISPDVVEEAAGRGALLVSTMMPVADVDDGVSGNVIVPPPIVSGIDATDGELAVDVIDVEAVTTATLQSNCTPWPCWKNDINDPSGAEKSIHAASIARSVASSPLMHAVEHCASLPVKSALLHPSMVCMYTLEQGSGTFWRYGWKSESATVVSILTEADPMVNVISMAGNFDGGDTVANPDMQLGGEGKSTSKQSTAGRHSSEHEKVTAAVYLLPLSQLM